MTAAIPLSLSNPDALLSALPHLLGFPPERSAVLVWLASRRILLTQRLDLPSAGVDLEAWADAACTHAAAPVADDVVIVMVGPEADVVAPTAALAELAERHGVRLKDALRVEGDRWWSLMCDDPDCCPPEGRLIDPRVRLEVAAEFAGAGSAPLASREEVAATLAADPALVAELPVAPRRPPTGGGLERWRDRVLGLLEEHLAGGGAAPARPEDRAAMLDGLADVRVRDTVLWEACRWDRPRLETSLSRLVGLLRSAPSGRVAPVATCVGLCAWLLGDGARARMALERVVEDDPGYTLAGLLDASIRGGLPPAMWRDAMADLTREDCRFGTQRPGARTA